MFARKVKNRSGSVSVQIISKETGQYRVVRTVGTSKDPDTIERLWQPAQTLTHRSDPQQEKLFALQTDADQTAQNLAKDI